MMRLSVAVLLAVLLAVAPPPDKVDDAKGPAAQAIDLTRQAWHGNALSYSGYRADQNPQRSIFPSQDQVSEDLRILARHFRLLRVYAADRHGEDVLAVIRREKLPLRVMLGIWIDGRADRAERNAVQIASGIRLANEYGDVVVAVNVGDEALASWSAHRTTEAALLEQLLKVKSAVRCPVTVSDDSAYWRQPAARLVDAVDFIAMHSYPVWNKKDADTAMAFTVENFDAVRQAHPGKPIVITQAGWPSLTVGEPFVPGAGSEEKQKRYYDELTAWARQTGVTAFVFEAFDEPWKGEGTERHWGLFGEDRRPKLVMRELFEDLLLATPAR